MRYLLKPQLPTSNYSPNAVFVSHFTPSLGGFPLALSPFEVDYRAGSVISLWKAFGAGGKEIHHPSAGVRTGLGDSQCCPANPSTQGLVLLWKCCSDSCSSLDREGTFQRGFEPCKLTSSLESGFSGVIILSSHPHQALAAGALPEP